MSIAPLTGVYTSAAGTPLAQIVGADVERVRQETIHQQRQLASKERADQAAGIAAADGDDLETNERDADGRRAWEIARSRGRSADDRGSAASWQYADPADERPPSLDLRG